MYHICGTYVYFFVFRTGLNWIVCGDCGMWRKQRTKKREKYISKKIVKIKTKEKAQIDGFSRHATRAISLFFFFYYLAKLPKAVSVLRRTKRNEKRCNVTDDAITRARVKTKT